MPAGEIVFPGVSPVFAGGRVLPSPSNFYLTGEERLRVVSANAVVGVSLKVQWRTANLRGETVPNSQDHTPNSDRTVKREDYELGSGSLLNVTVFASAGAPKMGQTFVIVELVRGLGAAAIVLGTLLAGPVTTSQPIGFPGSPILASTAGEPYLRAIVGATPAAGANLSEAVPTGARWELLSWFFQLVTSAAPANRKPFFQPAIGPVSYGVIVNFSTVPASTTSAFTFQATMASTSDPIEGLYQAGWGNRILLPGGSTLITGARQLQAGDQFSGLTYIVREWLEVD